MTKPTGPHFPYVDPPHVRRRFAEALRARADDPSFTAAEREEFRRMADAWAATLQAPADHPSKPAPENS
jgi:hypothetical protein